MNKTNNIGIFDSGVGGLSIWKELHQLMPFENTLYLADSLNAPYGNKSVDEILSLSIKNTETLIKMGSKIIVVACNTATTNAISTLRNTYDVPIIGIEPAIKPAALNTLSKNIGILATRGTLNSSLFVSTSNEFTNSITLHEVIGEGLVTLIENGKLHSPEIDLLLKKYTDDLIKKEIDYLVLGCTHYPFLIPQLKKLIPSTIQIIDSGEAVARQTQAVLEMNNLLNISNTKPELQFYNNKHIETMIQLLDSYKNDVLINTLSF